MPNSSNIWRFVGLILLLVASANFAKMSSLWILCILWFLCCYSLGCFLGKYFEFWVEKNALPKRNCVCFWIMDCMCQRWWQQYHAFHTLFLQCDFDTLPIEKWGLCSCSLNLGGLVGEGGNDSMGLPSLEGKGKTVFPWFYWDALHLEPATMLWESPCSHKKRPYAGILANRLSWSPSQQDASTTRHESKLVYR